ncbi:alpha/beta hydrolase family esterase [Amycolatopsis sacchari]|uniref:alpha/beta hydrolase family esterase n=1 Tax=Amycolatopsis sacchari TaxID=115433 RepID=UPI003D739E23
MACLAAFVALAACAAPAASAPPAPAAHTAPAQPAVTGATTTVQRHLTVAGTKRTYLAVGPSLHHKGLPLLVVLHGRGITAQQESARTGFLPYAQRGLADIVYPSGISQSWNAGHGCCGVAGREGVPDTAFVTAVVSDASQYFASDPRRVYLVGYSNGAKLSFEEVCEHPGIFAGIATYGAVPLADCPGGEPVSALLAAGTADPFVRTERGSPSATAALAQAVSQWQRRDSCPGVPSTSHTGPLTLSTWTGCATGTQLASAVYNGLTHYWPTAGHTSAPYTTAVSEQAAAATVMWDFLSRQRLA